MESLPQEFTIMDAWGSLLEWSNRRAQDAGRTNTMRVVVAKRRQAERQPWLICCCNGYSDKRHHKPVCQFVLQAKLSQTSSNPSKDFSIFANGECLGGTVRSGPGRTARADGPGHQQPLQEKIAHSCDAGISYRSLMREARAWAMDRQRNGGHDPFAVFSNHKDQKRAKDGSIECLLHCGSCSCCDMDFVGVQILDSPK